jgi:hypothetical protein
VPEPGPDALADRRQLVVVLRLVADTTGRLLYGEVIDVETGPTGRFVGWRGMTSAVRTWVARELEEPSDPDQRPVIYEPDTPVER